MTRFFIVSLLVYSIGTAGASWAGDAPVEKTDSSDDTPADMRLEPWWREKGDCGPLSLLVLMQLQNMQVKLDDIKKLIHAEPEEGCSLKDLQAAAEQLGLATEARYVEPRNLSQVPGPFILHGLWSIEKNRGHFCLILGYDSKTQKYATIDTILAKLGWLPEDTVLHGYSGYILVPKEPASQKWNRWTGYGLLFVGAAILSLWSFGLYRRRRRDETF